MPRKPRIDIPGFYHIINRGVEQRVIFLESSDYEQFLKILCELKEHFFITLHNYCLMNNHYHLLIQTQKPNLSKFMHRLNSAYAIYFNKKYNRSGHLWQGRFKSWYVANEGYLFILMRYIEQNPIRANIVKDIKLYPYSSYKYFLDFNKIPKCLKDSFIAKKFKDDIASIEALFEKPIFQEELQKLKKASSMIEVSIKTSDLNKKEWEEKLLQAKDKKERNLLIVKAYYQGVSQHQIAKILNISQPAVNGIIKRFKDER